MDSLQSSHLMRDSQPMSHRMFHVFLPDELITEVLSLLPVKPLMRLRCVSKSWNTLIYDPTFVNLHLKRSSRNIHQTLFSIRYKPYSFSFRCFPLRDLRDIIPVFPDNPNIHLNNAIGCMDPIGSCNGLICLLNYLSSNKNTSLYICNPATTTLSNKIVFPEYYRFDWQFGFGYDISTQIYKIVAFHSFKNEVRVCSLGDNIWRNIQTFPITSIYSVFPCKHLLSGIKHGVNVSGTLNWLATRNEFQYEYQVDWRYITIDQFVIVSVDLSTETYHRLLPPQGFDEVSLVRPTLAQLMGSLCLSHDFRGTEFIIWQMKEFGIQESWTQLFKISYQSLQIDLSVFTNLVSDSSRLLLLPLCLCENNNTLILASNKDEQPIVYNLRENGVEKKIITNEIKWHLIKDYVESLVSTSLIEN